MALQADKAAELGRYHSRMNRRNISRRVVQAVTLIGAAGSCWMSGVLAHEMAKASPAVRNSETGDYVPHITMFVLEWMHLPPTIGVAVAGILVAVIAAVFALSRNEDTRLQVSLWMVAIGYSVAVQIWVFTGIALVVLPNVANGI